MKSDLYKNYLTDLGVLIAEAALSAKQQYDEVDSEFSAGYLAGFHRVVSLMQQQAEAFGIPLDDIGLAQIDADADLT